MVRSLRIIHLTIYGLLICTFAVCKSRWLEIDDSIDKSISTKVRVSAHGALCLSPCRSNKYYFECKVEGETNFWSKLVGITEAFDYCSPIEGRDYKGYPCIPKICYIRNTYSDDKRDYNFCYKEEKTFWTFFTSRDWGYCSTESESIG